jgi:hypothetical protein
MGAFSFSFSLFLDLNSRFIGNNGANYSICHLLNSEPTQQTHRAVQKQKTATHAQLAVQASRKKRLFEVLNAHNNVGF